MRRNLVRSLYDSNTAGSKCSTKSQVQFKVCKLNLRFKDFKLPLLFTDRRYLCYSQTAGTFAIHRPQVPLLFITAFPMFTSMSFIGTVITMVSVSH